MVSVPRSLARQRAVCIVPCFFLLSAALPYCDLLHKCKARSEDKHTEKNIWRKKRESYRAKKRDKIFKGTFNPLTCDFSITTWASNIRSSMVGEICSIACYHLLRSQCAFSFGCQSGSEFVGPLVCSKWSNCRKSISTRLETSSVQIPPWEDPHVTVISGPAA